MKIRTIIIVIVAVIGTLAMTAQEKNSHPMQGRRRVIRKEMVQRRSASTQDRGPGGNYFTGVKHQLVVLASFADNPFLGDSAATVAQWDSILNAKQYRQAPFMGSLHDYFYDQSYGQFELACDLQFVRVDSCRRYRSTINHDENSQYLVQDVVATLKQRHIEWNLYDWNGDGYVNQLLIIFAGQGSAYGHMGPSYDAIWPHQWWLSMHLKDLKPGYYCDADTVRYQGADFIVDAYCAVQELSMDSTYGSFGTLCHEYTHCFGFPDIYSSSGKVIGNWDLMDNGNYAGEGFRPVGLSAHEKWLMGWLTPTELTTPVSVTDMPALADEPAAYIIRNEAYPNEFYMLENRQKKGWDSELPGSGLAVFHIDYDPEIWLSGSPNNGNEQHYVLIPANNRTAVSASAGWAYPYAADGNTVNDSLTDTSTPAAALWHANTSGQMLMSKPVTQIAIHNGLASFTFLPTPTGLENGERSKGGWKKVLRDGQLYLQYEERLFNVQGIEIR
jgi:M6 family metalloprotease-like protein